MPLNQSLNKCNEKLETNAVLRRYQGEEQEKVVSHVYIHMPSLKQTPDQVTRPSAVTSPPPLKKPALRRCPQVLVYLVIQLLLQVG